jgi:hypothetical protein
MTKEGENDGAWQQGDAGNILEGMRGEWRKLRN